MKLKVHVKREHCKPNSTQTEEILQDTKSSQIQKDIRVNKAAQTLPAEEKETKAPSGFTISASWIISFLSSWLSSSAQFLSILLIPNPESSSTNI